MTRALKWFETLLCFISELFFLGTDTVNMAHRADHHHAVGNGGGGHDDFVHGVDCQFLEISPGLHHVDVTVFGGKVQTAVGSHRGGGDIRTPTILLC